MRQNWFPADKRLLITIYYNCATALPEKHFTLCVWCICVCVYMCVCSSMMQVCVSMWKPAINTGHFPQPFLCGFLFVCLLYRGGRNDFWEVKKHIPVSGKGHREMSPLMYFFSGGVSHWSTDNVWAHWFSLTAQPVSSWDLPCPVSSLFCWDSGMQQGRDFHMGAGVQTQPSTLTQQALYQEIPLPIWATF